MRSAGVQGWADENPSLFNNRIRPGFVARRKARPPAPFPAGAPTEWRLALALTPTLFYENPFPVKPVFSHFDIPVALWSDIGAHL